MSARLGIFQGEGFEVDTGEVEERILIVGAKVAVGLVVCGIRAVESCVDLCLDGVKAVQY